METYNKPKAAAFVDISNIFYGARYAKWRISYKKIQEHLENKYELTFFAYMVAKITIRLTKHLRKGR
ncbi:MAG TPA: hypothetical protein DHI91_02660 [Candidatus Portnoybacteria bacterium]|uniref:NYN domain-containing protein n=1 Tax=Candidatus Portnoybacteria bacterium CG02_land_8_20_14_3_00_45_8 TaxID=1974807 RepID=A0A2M7D645_9BACT|nr:MAG: hypothetical protein COS30_01825 [Candidatus Portnoybacteria bacterium CG02_land_8_20_14_3_00_45_8]HCX28015.1 hypothetical protein [Candidatus Portnoybacteria bacterium]